MRVFIFFGHHKVGSSAIQEFMGRNAPALAAQGILYPAIRPKDAQQLKTLVRMGQGTQPTPRPLREAHNSLGFAMIADHTGHTRPDVCGTDISTEQMFATIRAQITHFRPETLVLVSEVFANFSAIDPPLIDKLFDGLGVRPEDVTAIAFLRRVDDYLSAWHGQRIRFGHRVPRAPDLLEHYIGGIHFDYAALVAPWAERCNGLRLLRYQPNRSVREFARHIGLRRNLSEPLRNRSIHPALIDIARQAQHNLAPEHAAHCTRFLSWASRLHIWGNPHRIEMWGNCARDRMYYASQRPNAILDRLTPDPLFPDLSTILATRPVLQAAATQRAIRLLQGPARVIIPPPLRPFFSDYAFETKN